MRCGFLLFIDEELIRSFNTAKHAIGLTSDEELHFRDLDNDQKYTVLNALSHMRFGLVAIVSNKRNMLQYRNLRCEAKNMEFVRGKYRPRRYNWFYNNLTRYLLERASAECRRWTQRAFSEIRSIEITFSLRKEFSYSQTRAYSSKQSVTTETISTIEARSIGRSLIPRRLEAAAIVMKSDYKSPTVQRVQSIDLSMNLGSETVYRSI
jgi:hypothetical protein